MVRAKFKVDRIERIQLGAEYYVDFTPATTAD